LKKQKPDKRIGLALGGGAILGAAHIGALKALEEKGIAISCISGTSIGAFVAALYAFGKSVQEIEAIAADLDWLDAAAFSLSKFGLLSNEKLGETFKQAVGDAQFSEAGISLALVATDIGSCEKVVLREGDVSTAVMASACVPGIFIPVDISGRMLVDGGLVENVPLSPLEEMGAEILIGVDLNARRRYKKPEDIVDVLANALDIAIDNATRLQTKKADLLITPELSTYSRTDTDKVRALAKEGYDSACTILKKGWPL
jgi:NTE family protein